MYESKKVPDSEVDALIEHITGSILSLYQACIEFGFEEDDLTMEQLEKIDSEIFNCTGCGWWYEIGEQNEHDDEPFCDNCIDDVRRDSDDDDDEEDFDF